MLGYSSEGCELESEPHQTAPVGPLGKIEDPKLLDCINEINVSISG